MKPRVTRTIRIGRITIGGDSPIAVQSMTATRTQDIPATIRQVELLEAAGADVIRIAVDNPKDVIALAEVRAARPNANLSIDLQENNASPRRWRRTFRSCGTTPSTSTTSSATSLCARRCAIPIHVQVTRFTYRSPDSRSDHLIHVPGT